MIADKFHGQISRQQAEQTPVYEFIADHAADFLKSEDVLRCMVQSYVTAWNLCVSCKYCKSNYSTVHYVSSLLGGLQTLICSAVIKLTNNCIWHPKIYISFSCSYMTGIM